MKVIKFQLLLKNDLWFDWNEVHLYYTFSNYVNQVYLLTEFSGIHNVKLYSYKELSIATDDFSPINKIGEGGFGSVYKVNSYFTVSLYLE